MYNFSCMYGTIKLKFFEERSESPLNEQDLIQLIALKREELYAHYHTSKQLTDNKIIALSQELDLLILRCQESFRHTAIPALQ
ncbi:Spo0E family sporulation regulatory protein-aspartic acid phosphatase [Fictibacillus iocasae]|uniref:Spo0E family sporulation regulatory protein-aspartic acid phosphatase n=1 Tax=Fictibacillus iocasae TaxID=2715437 RepID=A0ABW2NPD2_9BACL